MTVACLLEERVIQLDLLNSHVASFLVFFFMFSASNLKQISSKIQYNLYTIYTDKNVLLNVV